MRPGKKVAICRAWVLAKSPGLGDEACTGRIKHTPSADESPNDFGKNH